MEEARQNRYNRFLAGCPNRIGSGEPQREALRDADPESRGEERAEPRDGATLTGDRERKRCWKRSVARAI
jgi:hypothetical protein